jgi:hypothetical protein
MAFNPLPNIPRLGQGIKGGLGSLPNAPGSDNMGLPSLAAIPHLGGAAPKPQRQAPNPSVVIPNDGGANFRVQTANKILTQVGMGRMDVGRAKTMIQKLGLQPDERRSIAKGLLVDSAMHGTSHQAELMAIGQIPTGKDIGQTAPADPTHGFGVGANLVNDIGSTVTGMPAGIGLTGVDIGKDVGALVHGKAPTHTLRGVLEPIAHQYAYNYGPALQGNFGLTAHRLGQHPLAPILDAASLVSAGLGTAARTSEALDAIHAGQIAETAGGLTKVGGRFTIQPLKNGMFAVREGNNYLPELSNLPSKDAAVAAAKSLQKYGANPATAFIKGGGSRGRLLERYQEATGVDHSAEEAKTMKEVASVLNDPHLQMGRRTPGQTFGQVLSDVKATRAAGVAKAGKMVEDMPGFVNPKMARALGAGGTGLREASDLVRAGAIYLRPAYLPNNWVGNTFMNVVHQGVLAPVNLAKSLVMDKAIGHRYTAAMDKAMGDTPIRALSGQPEGAAKGYVNSVTAPVAGVMGKLADTPFRRAAFLHEARRAGFSKVGDVQQLFDRAAKGDQESLGQIATIGRKAQEEIVKFGDMNATERQIVRKLIFVYSWVRGAGRYAARFPLQHPMQSAALNDLSNNVGNPYLQKELGGVPKFLAGSVPVGHDKNGNPLLVNPFALNPLGTALQVGQAVQGTIKAMRGGKNFNKFADTDVASMTNPLIQTYLNAREGGKDMKTALEDTLAPVNLAHQLEHPGSGSIYPTSKTEAIGHYVVGSMYPREADQVALTKSLEREQQANPLARIPTDIATYKKLTGSDMPQQLIVPYKLDLAKLADEKAFQTHYAQQHGQSGFRNLPPQNRLEAALQYLAKGYASPSDIQQYQQAASQLTTDAEINSFANSLWASTGVGQYKQLWDHMMNEARGTRLTRKRQ